MSVCESCGASFDPATLPATVMSSRILCRPCYDKRQSEKYAAKAKAVATAGAAAPPPPAAAPSPAAPKPPPAPAHAPAGHQSPSNQHAHGHHSPSHQHAHGHHTPGHGSGVHAAPAHGTGHTGDAAHKPAASHAASRHGPKKKTPEPVDMKTALRAESEAVMDKTTKRGLLIAIAFVVVAGGVVAVTLNTKDKEEKTAAAYEKSLDDFRDLVKKEDVKSVEGANKIVTLIDARRDLWANTRLAGELSSLRVTATNTLQADYDQRQFLDRLTALEAQTKDTSNKTAEELRKLRITADTLAVEAQSYGAAAVSRANTQRTNLQQLIGTKVKEEAMTAADTQGKSDPRGALQKLGQAEDDVRNFWEAAFRNKDDQAKSLFEAYLRDLITRSDKLATEYFTPAVVEQTVPRDLLTGDLASEWELTKGAVKGSSAKIVGGSLFITGGGPDSKGRALYVIGDKEQWRDFVINGEFTLESGTFTMAFRLGTNLDRNTEAVEIRADDGKIAAGGTYAFTYQLIGSNVKLNWKDNVLESHDRELMYSTPRHGAFGIVVEKGAKVTFKRLLIRELR